MVAGTDNGAKTPDEESEQQFQEALEEELSPSGSKDLQGMEAHGVPLQVMRGIYLLTLTNCSSPVTGDGNTCKETLAPGQPCTSQQ